MRKLRHTALALLAMAPLAGAHGIAHNHSETQTEINQALDTGTQPLTGHEGHSHAQASPSGKNFKAPALETETRIWGASLTTGWEALSDGKIPPDSHIVMMLAGTQIANHETLKLSDYFTPLGVQILETAWNIQPVHHLNDTIARLFRLKGPVLQSKPANAVKWQEAVKAGSAATRKPVVPVLLCMDTFAGGTGSPVPWQKAYAEKVKDFGGSIEIKEYPHDDHFSLPNHCAPDGREWLNGLF